MLACAAADVGALASRDTGADLRRSRRPRAQGGTAFEAGGARLPTSSRRGGEGHAAARLRSRSLSSRTAGPRSLLRMRASRRSLSTARGMAPVTMTAAAAASSPKSTFEVVHRAANGGGTLEILKAHFPTRGEQYLRVWLPPGYNEHRLAKFPVLYLNDGQNLFEDKLCFSGICWSVGISATKLIEDGTLPPFVVVGIDHSGVNRSLDYCPYKPGTGITNFRPEAAGWPGGGVDTYLKQLVEEMLPFVENKYHISSHPQRRAFGGSSFGGIAALCAAMKYPKVFGAVLIESPSFWLNNGKFLDDIRNYAGPWPTKMYCASGSREYSGTREDARQDVDDLLNNYFKEFVALLESKGLKRGEAFESWLEDGAAHNEADWARRTPTTLAFLLRDWWRPLPRFRLTKGAIPSLALHAKQTAARGERESERGERERPAASQPSQRPIPKHHWNTQKKLTLNRPLWYRGEAAEEQLSKEPHSSRPSCVGRSDPEPELYEQHLSERWTEGTDDAFDCSSL